jgi:hypothetical protein
MRRPATQGVPLRRDGRYIDIVPKDDFVKLVVLLRVHNFAHLSEMRVTTKASGRSLKLPT